MRSVRISFNTIRRIAILFILYIMSGSTYITINNSLQRLPYLALVLMVPTVINVIRSKVSTNSFRTGLFVYGFSILVIIFGLLHGGGINSYTRIAVNFLFAYFITYEFTFDEFKEIFIKFVTAVAAVSLVFYIYLQLVGQIQFFSRVPNINNIYYRIGWIFNYIEYLPHRNLGIYWEPGLFATSLILALIVELIFKDKPSIWRLALFHICIITTYSTAGYVLLILCDLVLLNKWIVLHQSVNKMNYVVFFMIYIIIGFMIANLDAFLTAAGLLEHSVYGRLTTDNISNSMRTLAINRNLELFVQKPLTGYGISEAYALATGFSDTSTSTFLLVELGILGILPTIALIYSILHLHKDLIITLTLMVSLLFIINKEPHMGIAIVWVFMIYFMRTPKKENDLQSGSVE